MHYVILYNLTDVLNKIIVAFYKNANILYKKADVLRKCVHEQIDQSEQRKHIFISVVFNSTSTISIYSDIIDDVQ